MSDLFVYGGGGIGKEVLQILSRIDHYCVLGVIDDNIRRGKLIYKNFECHGSANYVKERFEALGEKVNIVIALGDPETREMVRDKLRDLGDIVLFPTIIDPSVSQFDVRIGSGCIISPGSVYTTGIEIGDFVFMNLSCTIGHDVKIGSFSTISPGTNISGDVVIEEKCYIGSGAVILPGRRIGKQAMVGAGSIVTKDVDPGIVVVGNPAKYLKRNVPERKWG